MYQVFSCILLLMQLHIFLSIHINHNISLRPDKSPKTVILWQCDKSVHCLFWGERKKKKNKGKISPPFPVYCLSLNVPSQFIHETAICVPFSSFCMSVWTLISSCLCRDTTAEFEGCNPQEAELPRSLDEEYFKLSWSADALSVLQREKYFFLCRDITGVGVTFTYKYNIFK